MVDDKDIGYYEELINGFDIVRARTIRVIRSWDFPRSLDALNRINEEFAKAPFPGIYVLFESKASKVYIGEAKKLYDRLKTHMSHPEDKIKNWDRAILVSDGRLSSQSDFNDNVIRHAIEFYLIKLFKLNKFNVVAQGEDQNINSQQKSILKSLFKELDYFLQKKGLISKFVQNKNEEEILNDELRKILKKNNYAISSWSAYEAKINQEHVYIRPGSQKSKGWQITFRDKFKNSLENLDGKLLIPRGRIILLPFSELIKVFGETKEVFSKSTIDIFIEFTNDGEVLLKYKEKIQNITQFAIN